MSGLRKLAELYEPMSQETPFGGRSTGWEAVGVVWLAPGRVRRRDPNDGGAGPRRLEAMAATARDDSRLRRDRMLRFDGGDWRIRGLEPDAAQPGRTILTLEREL